MHITVGEETLTSYGLSIENQLHGNFPCVVIQTFLFPIASENSPSAADRD
jgi:hypothetical protein